MPVIVRTLGVTVKIIVTVCPVCTAVGSEGVKIAVSVEDPTPLAVYVEPEIEITDMVPEE